MKKAITMKTLALVLLVSMATTSCRDFTKDELQERIESNTIEANFDFATNESRSVSIQVKGNDGTPLKSVPVDISIQLKDDSFATVWSGFTNSKGYVETEIALAHTVTNVLLHTPYVGLPANHYLAVEQLEDYVIQHEGFDVPGVSYPVIAHKNSAYTSKYAYLGSWNNSGVPTYKKHVRDVISQSMLDDINGSLPEYKPVPTYNPQYLADGIETNTKVVKKADVWVTFVHEGAGYKNVLGYYTYDLDNPPTQVSDIDSLFVVYPNVSYQGSGGGLVSGDKVHLGKFEPGTGIGWFLVANGYRSSSNSVGSGNWIVFSDSKLNPESDNSKKQHMVQLYDESRDVIILGFEDIRRDNSGCDNDFNDAIFYVTANPIEAIERGNLETVKKAVDSDGDGVNDYDDQFPLDPTKTTSSYSPSSSTTGSLCFEDNWPNMGDYDFNDLVIDYQYTFYTNAQNDLTELKAEFYLKAIGASMHNGFGLQFDIAPSSITSVSGTKYTSNYVTNNSNGTEANQSKATIIVFDDAHKHMRRAAGAMYVNTDNPNEIVDAALFTIIIKFANGVKPEELGKAPYNVFAISNGTRGREVHMVGYPGTDKADESMYGTAADGSNPDIKRYYQNKDNMPWALHTPSTLVYPLEKENIMDCYIWFEEWAKNEGRTYGDWYEDKTGYTRTQKLFKK